MPALIFVLTERQFSKLPDATKSSVNTRWAKVLKQYNKIVDECTHVRDTLQIVDRNLQEMTVERNKLAATLNEWSEQYRKITSEWCAPDELHCACVPALRDEISKLRAENEQLRKSAGG